MLTYPLGDFARITKIDAVSGAGINASWLLSPVNSLHAHVALLGYSLPGFELHYPEGAGIETVLTTDAEFGIDQHDTVLPLGYRVYRAGITAGRPGTVQAVSNGIS